MPKLSQDGDVFILNLGDGENRFNPTWIGEVSAALDTVSAAPAPRALVTTADGKYWSNGLDLEWMGAQTDGLPEFLTQVHELFARMLELDVPTVAAIQGHAFAAGAMLAVAHDTLVMREDRGYWCVPEADIGMPFTPGMNALLTTRLPTRTAHTAMLSARRYTAPQALEAGIVDVAVPLGDVLPTAIAHAATLAAKQPATLGPIKARLFAPALEALRGPQF